MDKKKKLWHCQLGVLEEVVRFIWPASQLPRTRISINGDARAHHTVHRIISLFFKFPPLSPSSLNKLVRGNYQGKGMSSCRANRSKQSCCKWGYRIASGWEKISYTVREIKTKRSSERR